MRAEQANAARAAAGTKRPQYTIKPAPAGLKIDGGAEDWRGTPSLEIARRGFPQHARVRLSYDAKFLYVLFEVSDESRRAGMRPTTTTRRWATPARRGFDRVQQLPRAQVAVRVQADRYCVEAAVPLESIGLRPAPGLAIRGDAGFISSDAQGTMNVARTYWSNQHTSLTSDMPSEAWLYPGTWGELRFE